LFYHHFVLSHLPVSHYLVLLHWLRHIEIFQIYFFLNFFPFSTYCADVTNISIKVRYLLDLLCFSFGNYYTYHPMASCMGSYFQPANQQQLSNSGGLKIKDVRGKGKKCSFNIFSWFVCLKVPLTPCKVFLSFIFSFFRNWPCCVSDLKMWTLMWNYPSHILDHDWFIIFCRVSLLQKNSETKLKRYNKITLICLLKS
jgi:hypothetical protein